MKRIVTSGKRKSAVARAVLKENGSGIITINKRPYEKLEMFDRLMIEEPIRIAKKILGDFDFDVRISARGGGHKGQIEACRLALARAILEHSGNNKELEEAFLAYDRNLLVADVRRKETYKPGDSKARRKRQTSYR